MSDGENNNEPSSELAVIESFEKKLSTAVETGERKIPQWQKKDILAMKEEHLGDLKSQIMYLKSNKKQTFMELYDEDISAIDKKIEEEYFATDEIFNDVKDKVKTEVAKFFVNELNKFDKLHKKLEDSKTLSFEMTDKVKALFDNSEFTKTETKNLFNELVEKMTNEMRVPISLQRSTPSLRNAVGYIFELEYGAFYKSAKSQIEKLEKLFKEALNFNDLDTSYKVYQEMKKADAILDTVEKHPTPKIEINLAQYIDKKELENLENEYEKSKTYTFTN